MPTMHACKHPALWAAALLVNALPAAAGDLSTSIMRPTPIDPSSGLVAGNLPGGAGPASYYLAADLKAGELMTQLHLAGRTHGERRLTLELLGSDLKVAAKTFVRAGFGDSDETTKSFAVDASGRHLIRLIVEGEETGSFCVLLGGTALPKAAASGCPGSVAAAPAPAAPDAPAATPAPAVDPEPPLRQALEPAPEPAAPPPPPVRRPVEIVVSQCEQRLRVGSDFLFDFDRAVVRAEADDALLEVSRHIAAAPGKRVTVEGHTDGKGTDGYNQTLSERRATAVRAALVERGAPQEWLITHGFGKSRPIAPNAHADGSDDPEGRQKNRRVEVVINTCS
jgi:outer membrane protein OmpA-like peptidoglycan-associated protein